MRSRSCIYPLLALIFLGCATPLLARKAEAPPWLQAARMEGVHPQYADEPAVSLLDHMDRVLYEDGRLEDSSRGAVAIQSPDGRTEAGLWIVYNKKTARVRDAEAWLIHADGRVEHFRQRDFQERPFDQYEALFSESATLILSCMGRAEPGSVFGWSYRVSDKSVFSQLSWWPQTTMPSQVSILSLKVPDGWTLEQTPVNKPEYTHSQEGTQYRWESRDQRALKLETWQPAREYASYIGLTPKPPPGTAVKTPFYSFDDWRAVARFRSGFQDEAAVPDDTIRAKTRALTAGIADPWAQVVALCSYAQSVNYISIDEDLSQGGGYKPFPAPLVLERNYGDCKDKTTLLRAMLTCIGIESYAVACRADTRGAVNPEWPSPIHFNHCIAAIVLPPELQERSQLEVEGIGHVMLFDPTSEFSPPGAIPGSLQNTFCLISSPKSGALSVIPAQPRKSVFEIHAQLHPDGALKASIRESDSGVKAAQERRLRASRNDTQYRDMLLDWLRRVDVSIALNEWSAEDEPETDHFYINAAVVAPRYAKRIGNSMLVFKPFMELGGVQVPPAELFAERGKSIVVPHNEIVDVLHLTLPEGFAVDELPKPQSFKELFGTLEVRYEVTPEGGLKAMRIVKMNGKRVEPDAFARLREFYTELSRASQASVVLKRI